MISINLNNEIKKNLKNLFRKWFFNRRANIMEFCDIVGNDYELKRVIFENESNYDRWKNSLNCKNTSYLESHSILEDFFFAEFNDPDSVHKYVINDLRLNEETKNFFKVKYQNFRNSQGSKFARELNVEICPYCNRNYIEMYNYIDKRGVKKRMFKGELDHYYSQSTYPHLSLCLFNLIPCCKVCNHEKLDENLETFHPYYHDEKKIYRFSLTTLTKEDTYDITFDELIDDLESKINDSTYIQGISDNFKIIMTCLDDDYRNVIESSKSVFRLEKKYNSSKEYVKELLKKRYIYSDSYAEMLSLNFNGVFSSPNDVKCVIFSNQLNDNEHNHRPLSKLTHDVLKELEVI